MLLIILLTTLCIDRLLWQADPYRQHRWFDAYARAIIGSQEGPAWTKNSLGALLVLLPLIVGLLLLQGLFGSGLGWISEFALGAAVLLFSLGPDDLGRQTESYLQARDAADPEHADELACAITGSACDESDPTRSLEVAAALPAAANRRLFAPILWFTLLGPLGAALYRLNGLLQRHLTEREVTQETLLQASRRLQDILDWLPARLMAAGFAAAGNFDAVAQAWKGFVPSVDTDKRPNDELLGRLGQAALLSWPREGELESDEIPPVVEDALALIWRCLVVWLLPIAAIGLISALA